MTEVFRTLTLLLDIVTQISQFAFYVLFMNHVGIMNSVKVKFVETCRACCNGNLFVMLIHTLGRSRKKNNLGSTIILTN